MWAAKVPPIFIGYTICIYKNRWVPSLATSKLVNGDIRNFGVAVKSWTALTGIIKYWRNGNWKPFPNPAILNCYPFGFLIFTTMFIL